MIVISLSLQYKIKNIWHAYQCIRIEYGVYRVIEKNSIIFCLWKIYTVSYNTYLDQLMHYTE